MPIPGHFLLLNISWMKPFPFMPIASHNLGGTLCTSSGSASWWFSLWSLFPSVCFALVCKKFHPGTIVLPCLWHAWSLDSFLTVPSHYLIKFIRPGFPREVLNSGHLIATCFSFSTDGMPFSLSVLIHSLYTSSYTIYQKSTVVSPFLGF